MRFGVVIAAALMVASCVSQKPAAFTDTGPPLVLEEALAGRSVAYGIFEDRFGRLQRRFKVDISGVWDGETLTLEEDFFYMDGEQDRRVWRLAKTGPGAYVGTAGDVVGEAKIVSEGAAVNLRYVVDLKVGDGSLRVRFNDWLYALDDGIVFNRAKVTKYGVHIGDVSLVFIPSPADDVGTVGSK